MESSIGRDCCVKLLPKKMAIRDLVIQEVEKADKQSSDRHFYMCDLGQVIYQYRQWKQLLPRVTPFYAVKCNDEFPVLKVLSDLGASFDCASKKEIGQVLDLGVSPSRIIYAHPCKQTSMLRYAEQKELEFATFDNIDELHKIKRIHPKLKLLLRINIVCADQRSHDFDCKFGCSSTEAPNMLKTAKKLELNVVGVSFHVGTNCQRPNTFSVAIQQARYVFDIGLQLGFNMKILNIGGGYPGNSFTFKTFKNITTAINGSLQEHFPPEEGVKIIAEPGRYMVCSTATVCVNIIARRVISSTLNADDEDDEATNNADQISRVMYYVNDGTFGSFATKLHFKDIFEPKVLKTAKCYESSIWGPTCADFDAIVDSTNLPLHEIGEWLYFENMGAYTSSLSAKFNGMEKPRRIYYCTADTWHEVYPDKNSRKTSTDLSQE